MLFINLHSARWFAWHMLVQSLHLTAQSPTPMVSYSQEVDAPGKLVAAKGCDLE